jgi:phosphate transport system substrate-binding protein
VRSKNFLAVLTAGALAFGVAACGDDDEETTSGGGAASTQAAEEPSQDLSSLAGTIRIDGSSTVQPVAEAAAEGFEEAGATTQITVGGVGTGDGFEKFCRGELEISDASRSIEAEELEACEKEGIEPVEVQVGIDGLSVIVNPALEVPNDCITTDQLKQLLAPGSKVKNYSELGEGWPDAPVRFFTPGTESGTYDFFTETVLETDAEQRTQDVQTSADDNQILTGISGTEGALGYVGFAFADQNKDKVKTLQVDGGEGCVEPNVETIASNEYTPLSRPLFMYPSKAALAKPEVKGFLQFVLDSNQEVNEAADYVPLTDELKATSQSNLDSGKVVTAADLEGEGS